MNKAVKKSETVKDLQLDDVISLHKIGKIDEAEKGYLALLDQTPNNAGVIYRLGILYMNSGKHDLAHNYLTQAVKIVPEDPDILNGLAALYMSQENYDEAVKILKNVLKIMPNHSGANCNMGAALSSLGQFDNAKPFLQKSLEIEPNQPETILNIAMVEYKENKFHEAIETLKKAISLRENYDNAWYRLGDCYKTMAHYREAEEAYAKAVEINPVSVLGWVNLGTMSLMHNKIDKAHDCYKKALELNPDDVSIYFHYSYFLNSADLFDEIPKLLEVAKKHIPDRAITAFIEARYERRQGNIEKALSILEPFKDAKDSEGTKVGYELGLIYDRLGEIDKAFECFERANKLYLQEDTPKVIRRDAMFNQMSAAEQALSPEWLESWTQDYDNPNYQDPIYLAGFPRSGTTLVDQILQSHPDIFVSPERDALTASVKAIEEKHHKYPDFLSRLSQEQVENMREGYYEMHKYFGDWQDKPVFVDKIPLVLNFMDLTYRMFPKSKIIFSLRHPCDCVLSCFMNEFTPTKSMILTADIELCAKFYHRTMELFEKFEQILPVPIYKFRYEDLIADLENEVRGILNFIEVPWNDEVLNYRQTAQKKGFISTPSHSQVKKEIYTTARYRWVKYKEHLAPVMHYLEPWIEKWGYGTEINPETNTLDLKKVSDLNLNKQWEYHESMHKLALISIKESNINAAIHYLNESIKSNKRYAPSYLNLAYCYNKIGDDSNAKQMLEKAIAINSDYKSYKGSLDKIELQKI
jgi:tetratricopeptide (TPR) repeat protein